jgi:hypothetical protein
MRYRDQNDQDWADIIDFQTMWPDARQRVVRVLGASRLRQIDVPAHESNPWMAPAARVAQQARAHPAARPRLVGLTGHRLGGRWRMATCSSSVVGASVPTPKDETTTVDNPV